MSPKMRRAAWPVVTAYLLAAIIYIIILSVLFLILILLRVLA
jgi:hypothetical protein